jgi:hypothetical protein
MLPSVALALVVPSDLAALPQDVLAELARLLAPYLPSAGGVEWLGTTDAASHLEYSVSTFEKHYREWGIPFYQDAPSCKLYFIRSELDQWRMAGGREGARSRRLQAA